ncbi:MAG: hypothetical protein JWQ79_323 [Mucilaginibacter sp.]|jgi:hypothetical protein|nr:hypothetical protein [Mucilaginibacter sp.]
MPELICMKHLSILLLFVILFVGCKPKNRNNEITKIGFARDGAWLDQGAAISINDSLTYKYYGRITGRDRCYHTGKISEGFWDTLNQKLEKIRYKTLDTTDNRLVEDGIYYEIIITWKNGRKHITRYRDIKTDSVLAVLNWINDSYKNVKLQKIKTPIKFETTFQTPPSPSTDTVKFPPPITKKNAN